MSNLALDSYPVVHFLEFQLDEDSIGTIRNLSKNDIDNLLKYFTTNKQYLQTLGFDPDNMPEVNEWIEVFNKNVEIFNPMSADWQYFSLAVNNEFVGYYYLDEIKYGQHADVHAFIISDKMRNNGLTSKFYGRFCRFVIDRYELKSLVFEPAKDNKAANQFWLSKGIGPIKTYEKKAASGTTLVNRYQVPKQYFFAPL